MRYIRLSDVNTILSWDKEAQEAYARAYASYIRAGSPPIPLGSTDYKTEYFVTKITGERGKTGLRIVNRVWLHENFPEGTSQDLKMYNVYCIVMPNADRLHDNFWQWFVENGYRDEFDDKLMHLNLIGSGPSKLKEVVDGLWMLREPRGICYIIEPKCAMTRETLRQELLF